MKRSRQLVLTTLMAGSAMSLSACDAPSSPPAQSYASLEECRSAGDLPAAECDKAYAAAQADQAANGPKFSDQQSCEERYGVDQCVPRGQAGGGFFTPLLTGFIVGQMMNNGGYGYGYGGRALYRDRYGQDMLGNGRPVSRDYMTGATRVGGESFGAPSRMQSRSAVISRGGFGGGSRSWGG